MGTEKGRRLLHISEKEPFPADTRNPPLLRLVLSFSHRFLKDPGRSEAISFVAGQAESSSLK